MGAARCHLADVWANNSKFGTKTPLALNIFVLAQCLYLKFIKISCDKQPCTFAHSHDTIWRCTNSLLWIVSCVCAEPIENHCKHYRCQFRSTRKFINQYFNKAFELAGNGEQQPHQQIDQKKMTIIYVFIIILQSFSLQHSISIPIDSVSLLTFCLSVVHGCCCCYCSLRCVEFLYFIYCKILCKYFAFENRNERKSLTKKLQRWRRGEQ